MKRSKSKSDVHGIWDLRREIFIWRILAFLFLVYSIFSFINAKSSTSLAVPSQAASNIKPRYGCGLIYFLHSGKTGGTSVEEWLSRHTSEYLGKLDQNWNARYGFRDDLIIEEIIKRLSQGQKRWFSVSQHDNIPGMIFRTAYLDEIQERLEDPRIGCTLKRITIFREPVQYYNSFAFWREIPSEKYVEYVGEYSELSYFLFGSYITPEKLSQWNFNPHNDRGVDANSVEYWNHIKSDTLYDSTKLQINDSCRIKTALSLLEKFDVIGLTHNLDSFFADLAYLIGVRGDFDQEPLNVQQKRYKIDPLDLAKTIQARRTEFRFYYKMLFKFFDEEENFIMKNRHCVKEFGHIQCNWINE